MGLATAQNLLESPAGKQVPTQLVTTPSMGDVYRVVAIARGGLAALCEKAGIPESHGLGHASRVLDHVENALAAARIAAEETQRRQIPAWRCMAIRLAALLHDADDRKYFRDCPKGSYPNAEALMREALGSEEGKNEIVENAAYDRARVVQRQWKLRS